MAITREAAEEALATIHQTARKVQMASNWMGGDLILMLWGMVWIFAFLGCHYDPPKAGWYWLIGDVAGITGTMIVCLRASEQVRSKEGARMGVFWGLLFLFIFVELAVLHPWDSLQMNAFICLQIMLGFVVIGLWVESHGMIALAGVVTVCVLAGYFLLQPYYYLWMALMGGGSFFTAGVSVRLMMRRS